MKVYNIVGMIVAEEEITQSQKSIDLTQMDEGMYLFQYNDGEKVITKRINLIR